MANTIATESQVRERLAREGMFTVRVNKGQRTWDPISKRGWSRGAGLMTYYPPADDGFVAAAWDRASSRGSDLHSYDWGRRHGVTYR